MCEGGALKRNEGERGSEWGTGISMLLGRAEVIHLRAKKVKSAQGSNIRHDEMHYMQITAKISHYICEAVVIVVVLTDHQLSSSLSS